MFQHVNNVNYFSYFDTAVTSYGDHGKGGWPAGGSGTSVRWPRLACPLHSSLAFPDRVLVGIRVAHIGRSSVRYEIGVFRNDDDVAAARGPFCFMCSSSEAPSGRFPSRMMRVPYCTGLPSSENKRRRDR